MLQRVMMDGIELPRLYIAEDRDDVELAKSKGIPFIRWTQGQEMLIKVLLRPVLERKFPHINWNRVLGPRRKFRTKVERFKCAKRHDMIGEVKSLDDHVDDVRKSEPSNVAMSKAKPAMPEHDPDDDDIIIEHAPIANNENVIDGGGGTVLARETLDLEEYVGDMSSYVNIEILQRLRLMPAFIGDILDCVKLNMGTGMYWSEGYNKKRSLPVGRYGSNGQLPNLVILDISYSIPRGISATMISLIDTLRTQLSADLIITAKRSGFYPMGAELPKPQDIRRQFPCGNESSDFCNILTTHIRGRHYGHVFSFGDDDTPAYDRFKTGGWLNLEGTVVEHVHHYHTWKKNGKTGYAKWCHMLGKQPMEDYDTSWCSVIEG